MKTKILLQCNSLNKSYTNKYGEDKKIIKDLNLDVFEYETLGLVGESGSGKSTLAKLILQLICPDSGEIYYKGDNILNYTKKEKRKLKKDIQYVFQDPGSALNKRKTISWLLEEPLKIHTDLTSIQRQERVKEMIELVGLSKNILNRYPHSLSGGQAQRVAVLTALMNNPSFVIADEPVSALDVSVQAQILNLLQQLKEELKLTIIFITHDLSVCYYMADRIAVMFAGRIVEIGDVESIYNNPQHPYTQELFQSILTVYSKETDFKVSNLEIILPKGQGCDYASRCPYRMDKCVKKIPDNYKSKSGSMVKCFLFE